MGEGLRRSGRGGKRGSSPRTQAGGRKRRRNEYAALDDDDDDGDDSDRETAPADAEKLKWALWVMLQPPCMKMKLEEEEGEEESQKGDVPESSKGAEYLLQLRKDVGWDTAPEESWHVPVERLRKVPMVDEEGDSVESGSDESVEVS